MFIQKNRRPIKIGLITSAGGHLFQIYQLKSWWKSLDRFWVSIDSKDVTSLLRNERYYLGHGPESRNIINAIRNCFLAWKIIQIEKPTLLISCGAGIAPPFFWVGKLFGVRLIYIEPYDFISQPSLSGRLVELIVSDLYVQHPKQLRFYQKAKYRGALL